MRLEYSGTYTCQPPKHTPLLGDHSVHSPKSAWRVCLDANWIDKKWSTMMFPFVTSFIENISELMVIHNLDTIDKVGSGKMFLDSGINMI